MKKEKLIWRTERRRVNDLIPFDKNPRTLSEKQEKDLKRSIEIFDLVEIPAVDTDNKILAGHQRAHILQLLGRGDELIDVRVPSRKLSDEEYEEYLLRSNSNTGSWNYDLLKSFDLDLLLDVGFDNTDLSAMWDSQLEVENDDFEIDREIKKALDTNIKEGDFFKLGNHYLLCSDSTKPETIETLMQGKKANLIYCDPVYNIGLNYDKGFSNKNYGGDVDDNKTDTEYREFLRKTIKNALAVGEKDLHVFYYSDQRYIGMLQDIYRELGIKNQRVCLWVKNGFNATPQVAFNKSYEPCTYGTVGRPYLSETKNLTEILNKEIHTGNQAIDDIIDIFDIWLAKRLPGQEYSHPTEKPCTLHEKPIKRCSKVGDIVLDLFAGSGSTMCSCEQLKRRCFMVELNPIFCQVIINRFERSQNEKVRKLN